MEKPTRNPPTLESNSLKIQSPQTDKQHQKLYSQKGSYVSSNATSNNITYQPSPVDCKSTDDNLEPATKPNSNAIKKLTTHSLDYNEFGFKEQEDNSKHKNFLGRKLLRSKNSDFLNEEFAIKNKGSYDIIDTSNKDGYCNSKEYKEKNKCTIIIDDDDSVDIKGENNKEFIFEDEDEKIKKLRDCVKQFLNQKTDNLCLLDILNDLHKLLENNMYDNLYEDIKDILPLLVSYIKNKNSNNDILIKTTEILLEIKRNIIEGTFNLSDDNTPFLPSKLNFDFCWIFSENEFDVREYDTYPEDGKNILIKLINEKLKTTKVVDSIIQSNSNLTKDSDDKKRRSSIHINNDKEKENKNLDNVNNKKANNPALPPSSTKLTRDRDKVKNQQLTNNSQLNNKQTSSIDVQNDKKDIKSKPRNIIDDDNITSQPNINNINNNSNINLTNTYKSINHNNINNSQPNIKGNNIININLNELDTKADKPKKTSSNTHSKKQKNSSKKNSNNLSSNALNNNKNNEKWLDKKNKSENNHIKKKDGISNNKKLDIKDEAFRTIYDKFIKVITNCNEKDINEIINIANEFINKDYDKNNKLDFEAALIRKNFCKKIFHLLQIILNNIEDKIIQKIVIFFEYKLRNEDPTLGKKYLYNISLFYNKMIEVIRNKKEKNNIQSNLVNTVCNSNNLNKDDNKENKI